MHQSMLGTDWLESNTIKRALGVLVGAMLTMSQQCALAAKKNNSAPRTGLKQVEQTDPPSLLSTGEATYERVQSRDTKKIKGLEHVSYDTWDCSAWKTEGLVRSHLDI